MLQIKAIPRFLVNNLYLLVLAAWLVTFSFIIDNYWSADANLGKVQAKMRNYVRDAEEDFAATLADSRFSSLASGNKLTEEQSENLIAKDYFIFLYGDTVSDKKLAYWNTQKVLPDSGIIKSAYKAGFAQLENGFYVWNKLEKGGTIAIALIPIKWNYIVTNEYLKNNFKGNARTGLQFDIFPGESGKGNIASVYDVPLFYLLEKNSKVIVKDNLFSVWLRILAAFFILLFIHICAVYFAGHKRFATAVAFLLGTVLLLRFISYLFPIPLNFRQLALFDPTVYGSNFILRSLGDLLVNAVLFLWLIMFIRVQTQLRQIKLPAPKQPYQRWLQVAAGIVVLLAATYIVLYIIRSLIIDSKISFDVINFFSLNIYSVVGFIVLCSIAIGYYFLCQVVLYFIRPAINGNNLVFYLGVAIAGLLFLSMRIGSLQSSIEIVALGWLLLFLYLLNSSYLNLITSHIISSKLVFWIFFFSISITTVIIIENIRKELQNRYHYAEVMADKTDPASESMLSSMLADFRVEFLADNFVRLKNPKSNKFIKDSLINNNFSGYTNRYDTRIYSFDENELPLFNSESAAYDQLNTILNTQSKPTGITGLFYYDEAYDRFSYIGKKDIRSYEGNFLGTIFILVTPKKVKNEKLYPELFSKGSDNSIENSSAYAFAIYNKGKLTSSYNDYPFSTSLPAIDITGKEYLLANKKNYDELWYNAGADKYIVIVKENRRSLESITLFSYLFCSFLFLTALFWVLTVFVSSRFNPEKLRTYWQMSIRNQIHGIIIFISAVSFIVIGVATILFFISRYESNNREKLSRAIQIMKNQVSNSFTEGWQLNDSMLVTDRAVAQKVEKDILNIAEIHGVDVNIYDLQGNLKLASLPLPYVKGIVSTKMDPRAYFHLNNQKEVQYFQKESIGNLTFVSSYVPVFETNGNVAAYLNIPYFTSQSKLQQEIANFLVTIINLNAFIFLIAGIVALFIANSITRSFSLIGEKMKDINLGKINEAIVWNRNDEIGSLVQEYNKMLGKLDESAAALAKTEREGAWREMARQVAHEIKNPLTPMKLSMQFLQRSIENDAPNVKQLTANVAKTLVEQIDHLSNIASEFSQFANIGSANKEVFDINTAMASIELLYAGNEEMSIKWTIPVQPIMVDADKTHINRLFTNLIQNALQAVPLGRIPEIEVKEILEEEHVLILVKDNGEGIPDSIQAEIFTPNFTTKTSGTGLGLAMCKRIVEQMNGQIWFETSRENGTIFFVRLRKASR